MGEARVRAWRPAVAGISEVFHAEFADHAYPVHTHATWDLMILDDGAVDFALDRHRHGVRGRGKVILLPPGVPHDGRTVGASGFRKRVVYLDTGVLPARLAGSAVDLPVHGDALLRRRVHQLHAALHHRDDAFEGEGRLAFIRERLLGHLTGRPDEPRGRTTEREAGRLASALRELLEARLGSGLTLAEASALLHADPTHLVRCFRRAYGLPPHAYLTGRRVERARSLLLDGMRPADVAPAVGFYDQAHLGRHFTRHVGVPPGRYAASHRGGRAAAPARAADG
ncbi:MULTISPECIES: helix-turn-helix domain-containing protein [Streptomyces]|uniref:helix-turn-helix domain-containing protein n=1 Tax=Streptomyces TaxID=1883 RepID=UPI00224880BD|nr:AraC family transcriptional regulator [Streptomyces sp. JHD 1]MCX2971547.1 AraC family transcriptional regulator [Streptomyces sp. JHD 1]